MLAQREVAIFPQPVPFADAAGHLEHQGVVDGAERRCGLRQLKGAKRHLGRRGRQGQPPQKPPAEAAPFARRPRTFPHAASPFEGCPRQPCPTGPSPPAGPAARPAPPARFRARRRKTWRARAPQGSFSLFYLFWAQCVKRMRPKTCAARFARKQNQPPRPCGRGGFCMGAFFFLHAFHAAARTSNGAGAMGAP